MKYLLKTIHKNDTNFYYLISYLLTNKTYKYPVADDWVSKRNTNQKPFRFSFFVCLKRLFECRNCYSTSEYSFRIEVVE